MSTATKSPPKAWRSGWCGFGNPPASHQRCAVFAPGTGAPCVCDCHTTSGPDDKPVVETTLPQPPAAPARDGRASSVIGYYGSKHGIAADIVSMMPDHRGYIEPYAGSLAVLAAKRPSPFECVNDLDGDLMTFWRVLRDRCDELERVASLTPHSRAEYQGTWPPSEAEDDLARAWRVWVQLTQGRGGQLRRTGWRYHEITRGRGSGMPVTLAGYVGRFAAAADRLRNVSLECLPALDIIARYGRDPQTLMYVDPPYLGTTRSRTGYQVEMTSAGDHTDLADALHHCEATVLLSGYASPLYDDELYADWHRHEIHAWTGQGRAEHTQADGRRVEVMWSNRPLRTEHTLDLEEDTSGTH